jgi:MSHA biogenesis protein MshM
MYAAFFGLREAPFGLTPDTSYFYPNAAHRDALETLLVALGMGEGFIKLVGEVGTGKTLLCRLLLRRLADDPSVATAYIPNPALTPAALRHALAEELGLDCPHNLSQHQILQRITDRLIELRSAERKVILIIDEAQALPPDCLEAVRLLTNLETEKSKLLQVVLLGQPELEQRLAAPAARQLRQRITFSARLEALDAQAVEAYLRHRIGVAGGSDRVFSRPAMRAIARASGGIPRLVNILAHKALLSAFGQGSESIQPRHVRRAVADTEALTPDRARVLLQRAVFILTGAFSAGAAAFGTYWFIGVSG